MTSSTGLNQDMSRHPLGSAEKLDGDKARLTLSRDYSATPAELWAMLTDPEKTVLWWAKVRGQAKSGSSFDLKWLNVKDEEGNADETEWWNGKVVEAVENETLEITNVMHGTIRAELQPTENGTQLTFVNVLDVPEEVIAMSLAGWHVHLDHLHEALDGKAVAWTSWWDDFYPSWEQVHAQYQQLG